MNGVYIRGMEMPKDGTYNIVHIYSDGHVSMPFFGKGMQKVQGINAVPIQPHGRLIDADELIDYCKHFAEVFKRSSLPIDKARRDELLGVIGEILNAPTIIPAEPSEEQREYEAAVEAAQYCEMYEPTYDPETGAM